MNYRPTSRTKTQDLTKRLNQASIGRVTDEVALRRIEADAKKLMHVDPAGAHVVSAGVAANRRDVEGIHHHYRIALQHEGDRATMLHNYSVALAHVGELQDSYTAAKEAHEATPADSSYLDNAIKCAFKAGCFRMVKDYCAHFSALRSTDTSHKRADVSNELVAALDAGAFSQSAVQRVLGVASSIQSAKAVRSAGFLARPDRAEPHSFLFQLFVYATPKEAAALNAALADEIVSHDDLMEDPGLRFIPMFVGVDDTWR